MSQSKRPWMDNDLEMLRDTARKFFERECVPNEARWTAQHHADMVESRPGRSLVRQYSRAVRWRWRKFSA